MTASLPVADSRRVGRAAAGEIRSDKRAFTAMVVLNVLAAAAGLIGPRLLGTIVDRVEAAPGPAAVRTVDRLALLIVVFTVAQVLLARCALYVGARFGERTAARVRERFLGRALALPASVAERVPLGDLVARGTNDVDTVAGALRNAVPDVFIACVQVLFIIGAVLLLDPLLGLCGLSCLAVVVTVLRWYLRRARSAYLAEGAAGSALGEVLTTTADGARTVEALGLQRRRIQVAGAAIAEFRRARLRTLWLRTVLFPIVDTSYTLPLVGVLLIGGALYYHGAVSLGTVVACALYLRQLVGPLDSILLWVEQLQQSGAAYARVEGLAAAPRPTSPPPRSRPAKRSNSSRCATPTTVTARCCTASICTYGPGSGSPWSDRQARANRPSADSSRGSTSRAAAPSPSAVSPSRPCRRSGCVATSSWSPRRTTSSTTPCVATC